MTRDRASSRAISLSCLKCGARYALTATFWRGCDRCSTPTFRSNLAVDYDWTGSDAAPAVFGSGRPGLWRFASLLPVEERYAVSLGEGSTPLTHLTRLGEHWQAGRLYVKNESVNPTWSHKDRLAALATAAALKAGAGVVTVASTGNHGAAVAAYAARAGLRCVVFTLASVPDTMKTLMQVFGAEVIAVRTHADRMMLMQEGIEHEGWYPMGNSIYPAVGSNPFGVDGYKTISYEIFEQLGRTTPDWVIVPVANGDCLAGVDRGFADLVRLGLARRKPRLIGTGVFGTLEKSAASKGEFLGPMEIGPTAAFSIASSFATYQSVAAIQDSEGMAHTVVEEDLLDSQLALGRLEGLYCEAASGAGLASARRLLEKGVIGSDEIVVSILTSSGLKDPASTSLRLPPVKLMEVEPRRSSISA